MKSKELKIGDVVKSKSGSPLMTVTSVYDDDEVCCRWFEGKHTLSRKVSVLKLA